jgi:iron-sulfur cluster repair protein YtfE (RIC family)
MKRAEAFQPLSHDHHRGLHMAARIRRALHARVHTQELAVSVPAFWTEHLVPHFAEEEALVVPLLRRGAPLLAEQMLQEHETLRVLTEAVVEAEAPEQALAAFADALAAFADALAAHIRFEEREAFPAAERIMAAEASASRDGGV